MKKNVLWFGMALALVAVLANWATREEKAGVEYNISGMSLGMSLEDVKARAPQSEANLQGPVTEIKIAEPSGRQTRAYVGGMVLAVFGYNLCVGDVQILTEGDSKAALVAALGEPTEKIPKRHDVVYWIYPEHSLRVSLVGGKTQEIALGDSTAQPTRPNPESQYKECLETQVHIIEKFREDYGPEGVVPMRAIHAAGAQHPCPAAGKPTISATGTGAGTGVSMTNLILFCRGTNHTDVGAPEHFPEVHSVEGPRPF